MRRDKANTLDCPFVARKCRAERCMAWRIIKVPQSIPTEGQPAILAEEEVCSLLK